MALRIDQGENVGRQSKGRRDSLAEQYLCLLQVIPRLLRDVLISSISAGRNR